MKTILATVLVVSAAVCGAAPALAADVYRAETPAYQAGGDRDGVQIGRLVCDIGGGAGYLIGSAKQLDCLYQSSIGSRSEENYSGTIRKLGVDIGYTRGGRLIWAVFAPTAGYHHGALGGVYRGATVEATLGAGVGANVLVGGTANAIQLQTISVQGQTGLNIAATGTSLTLNAVN